MCYLIQSPDSEPIIISHGAVNTLQRFHVNIYFFCAFVIVYLSHILQGCLPRRFLVYLTTLSQLHRLYSIRCEECEYWIWKDQRAVLIASFDVLSRNWPIYGSTAICWALAAYSVSWFFYTVDRTHWKGDQPVARPLPAHRTAQTQNTRTQTSLPQVFERAKTHTVDARPLWSVRISLGTINDLSRNRRLQGM
jgi:hypothetical protein